MRNLLGIALATFSLVSYGQNFIGDISGKMVQNGIPSEFTWRFEEDRAIYMLDFEIEHEKTHVEITFDGDTTANIDTYTSGALSNSSPISVSQLVTPMPVIIDQYSSAGTPLMDRDTKKIQVRTEDTEVAIWVTDLSIDWKGAQYFFRDDIGFLIASEDKGMFPLKSITTDLKGILKASYEVTSIEKK